MCETEKTMTEVAQILPIMIQRGTFTENEQITINMVILTDVVIVTLG